jgi:hypothetical protein
LTKFRAHYSIVTEHKLKTIMARTTGRFYFKKTSNGNLIGEFSNHAERGVFTESSDLTTPPDVLAQRNHDYRGTYASHWREGQTAFFADLTISSKPNSTALFCLEWRATGGATNYDGEAMLCDDMLVGDYHSI